MTSAPTEESYPYGTPPSGFASPDPVPPPPAAPYDPTLAAGPYNAVPYGPVPPQPGPYNAAPYDTAQHNTAPYGTVPAQHQPPALYPYQLDQPGYGQPAGQYPVPVRPVLPLATLDARAISAWFGTRKVLDRVSLTMQPGRVTALIGPSGCGKSTFLRILNRMHELVPSAQLAGEVLLDGADIYDTGRRLTDARRQIGMVFQKPNPFPTMSIYDNVVAGLKLTGLKVRRSDKDALVEECLTKGGLWREVKDRLRSPGGALSGGQQQRLCIARSLAIRPRVLLMDEPCSALDPTSTRVIEETIAELASEVTIVIVTHNMQQANRVSQQCAFFLAENGAPGAIVESGDTEQMFGAPVDQRTSDYVNGRFG
jgi:phosphate transport system ATP-binding protein